MKNIALGVDIGGSHICSVAVDLAARSVIEDSRAGQRVDNQAPADAVLGRWAETIGASLAGVDRARLAGIGFAMPGPFDYAGGIALFTPEVAKYQGLHGVNVSKRLREMLALPAEIGLRYLNDAAAFGVGEAWLGETAGAKRSIAITLGTGLGSAFVADGIPVVEGDTVPRTGALWHLPFQKDIADAAFSARWFIRRYAESSGSRLPDVRQIADRAATDARAGAIFVEFGANLADFLGPWIASFGAEILVIGGNVSGAYPLFGSSLEAGLARQRLTTAVRVSKLKEDAATIGGARMFDEPFWTRIRASLSKM